MLVDAEQREFNYQTRGRDRPVHALQGQGRREAVELVRRAAFALRFGDLNPLISGQITSNTKLLMERDIRDRVRSSRRSWSTTPTRTPWCSATARVWVLDGYTTTDHVPVLAVARAARAGSPATFNYVRNSVKATVDAYDGTVKFYVVDRRTRSSRRTQRRSPTCSPTSRRCRTTLREHLRYPRGPLQVADRPCSAATT